VNDLGDVVTGFLLGGVIAGLLAYQRAKTWDRRAQQVALSLSARGDDLQTYLLSKGSALESELTTIATKEADRVARASADNYLATRYGLTQTRIRKMERLGEMFG
jgi:hypothetical protein